MVSLSFKVSAKLWEKVADVVEFKYAVIGTNYIESSSNPAENNRLTFVIQGNADEIYNYTHGVIDALTYKG